jgi:hypothetical protein
MNLEANWHQTKPKKSMIDANNREMGQIARKAGRECRERTRREQAFPPQWMGFRVRLRARQSSVSHHIASLSVMPKMAVGEKWSSFASRLARM